ncbi:MULTISPECIES: hypothetical protein [Thalassospira]|uniref:Transposase n=1 Tax=Thalassospira aquimaris TaxID=3037796 RepID=A0ABT6GEA6_9PROT|nr:MULTISPECIES: hypothetical protein [Thalassospira]MDG4720431.1 hypothetical protein [Thalassospira sp. FZY0004]
MPEEQWKKQNVFGAFRLNIGENRRNIWFPPQKPKPDIKVWQALMKKYFQQTTGRTAGILCTMRNYN